MTTHLLEKSTPASLGYFMPAEWEPHSDTWLAWPRNLDTWSKNDLHDIESIYIKIICNLIKGERINILINDDHYQNKIITLFHRHKLDIDSVRLHKIPTEDAWVRDFGPNFLVRETPSGRQIAVTRWRFNSWGEKYPWEKDDSAEHEIVRKVKLPWFDPGIILEGGAIDVNGKGSCLTTTSCLLNSNRNGGPSLNKMEKYLKDYLGVDNIIWLNGVLQGDDTDGHVDNLARFVNPTTIVYASEENKNDVNYLNLKSIVEPLKKAINQDGNPFKLIPLPMPRVIRHENFQLPASYVNFYIGNHVVLVPAFNDPNDEAAENILRKCFPGRKIVRIDSRILIKGQGGLHCITQQQPAH